MKFEPQLELEIASIRERVDGALCELLQALELPEPLAAAANYTLLSGGKRLRPVITLLAAADSAASHIDVLPAAVAIELLHTASLIHDDLPGMDNDDYRRGRLSCHRQYSEGTAILLGDLLPAVAFEHVATSHLTQLNQYITRAYRLLCVGQQMDMVKATSLPELIATHRHKTGALFAASVTVGAAADLHDTTRSNVLWRAGEEFGLLFQMVDDYLDRYGSAAERGRPESSDIRNEKSTLFSFLDLPAGRQHIAEQYARFLSELRSLEDATGSAFQRLRSLASAVAKQAEERS